MIRPLRARHRSMITALSVIVPVIFVVGLASRRPVPISSSLPTLITGNATIPTNLLWSKDDLWTTNSLRTRVFNSTAKGESLWVEVSASTPIARPDLLLYWAPDQDKASGKLSAKAVLLGAFAQSPPRPLPLPTEAARQSGVLILYSLADQEIVTTSNPFNAHNP